jgi:hypothetical protein
LQTLSPPPLRYYADIQDKPLPPILWEIEGLVVQGSINMLYGDTTAMKSWLAASLGLHLATGKPWLGNFKVVAPRRVLYLDEEMGETLMDRRLLQVGTGANLRDDARRFRTMSHLGLVVNEQCISQAQALLEHLDFDPEVIIIDSLCRVIDGDENKAQDVRKFWACLRAWSGGMRTIYVVHHVPKPTELRQSHSPRGSGDMLGGVDAALFVKRTARDLLAVEHRKARVSREHDPFVISVASRGDDSPVALSCVNRKEGPKPALSTLIVGFLREREEPQAKRSEVVLIAAMNGHSEQAVDRALKAMVEEKALENDARGSYRLTSPKDFPREESPNS